jgi:PAT family beta-lactamase induction signal transducer AmpG
MKLFLRQSALLRYLTFTVLYTAQGIPIGLFTIALPAWLAENGAGPEIVGSLVAITGLPWAFKLVSGPFMDRFSLPSMGRRRPWVIGAQLGLCVSFLGLLLVNHPLDDLWILVGVGLCVNTFAALQDVAVDGMAIDVLPAGERGRANALMACGQVVGFSGFGALAGLLLNGYGLGATGIVAALLVGAIVLLSVVVRERSGERMLPWTTGAAAPRKVRPPGSFGDIFGSLARVLLLPMSLVLVAVELVSRASAGIYVSLLPVLSVQELGYSSEAYANWFGLTGAISAFLGILIGPVIDRYGAARLLSLSLLGSAATALTFALCVHLWSADSFVVTCLMVSQIFAQGFFVSMIAIFMGICWTRVAATQFAVYMSLANLSRSLGAGVYALLATDVGATGMLLIMAGLLIAGSLLLRMFDADGHEARLAALEARLAATA